MGIVIGLGETGKPLYEVLKAVKPSTHGYDKAIHEVSPHGKVLVMNICIPYSDKFIDIVKEYQCQYLPSLTIIHSTVPIGTTALIPNAVHSPILGRHDNMVDSIRKFEKWVGGPLALLAKQYLGEAGIKVRAVETSQETETLKLLCLAKYGMSIAFAQYAADVLKQYDIPYSDLLDWDVNYNANVDQTLRRPLLTPPGKKIGGHCIVQNTEILNKQHPNPILEEILKYSGEEKTFKVWEPSKVYSTAKIGRNVNIGAFCEIGNNVEIGDNVRIGAMSFIPEGVTIHKDAWIGPRCTFTNDMYPPSGKENWKKTVIGMGARLGASVTVLPGVTIGRGALIGAGSVITHDVPAGERWCGVPARRMEVRDGNIAEYAGA